MSTYQCPSCNRLHSVGGVPEEQLSYLIPDGSIEDLVTRIVEEKTAGQEQRRTNIDFMIITAGSEVYHCPDCGTLVITGGGKLAGAYRPLKS